MVAIRVLAGIAAAVLLGCGTVTDVAPRAITRADEAQAAVEGVAAACQSVVEVVPLTFVGSYSVRGRVGIASVTGSKTVRDSTWSDSSSTGSWIDTTTALSVSLQSFGTSQGLTASGTASCWHGGEYLVYFCGISPYHGCIDGWFGADSVAGHDLAIDFAYEGIVYRDNVTVSVNRHWAGRTSSVAPPPFTGTLTTGAGVSFAFP